ncbi:UNVERIFIED_CONTAM: Transposon Tf2-11 polyprotein [Sesamum indicum]
MGPRRTATAARASGQDPESPRHAAASSSERAENPEDGHSRLVELETKVSSLESEITVLNSELDECRHVIQEMAGVFGNDSIADMRRDMEQMSIQIGLLQRAVGSTPMVAHDPGARLRIPEPKAYSGERDAKEVENFLFDMEQYFLAADVRDEARKVATATMYLTGDAKLWWRTKFAEIQAHQIQLDTWALLREAIREQFFPENVEYNARRALRKLEHTGSVREYVKAFSALMLNIRDMSEADKLFTFMEGLKQWARNELQRQRVTDLSSAIIAAERLADFNLETQKDRQATPSPEREKSNGTRWFRNNFNRGGGDQRPHSQNGSQGSSNSNRPQENRQGAPERRRGCLICDGPHMYRDCPKRQVLNALATTFTDKASSSKSVEPQAEAGGENDTEEYEDNLGAVKPMVQHILYGGGKESCATPCEKGPSRLLLWSQARRNRKEEEVQPRIPRKKGLMFVDVKIHGKPIRAMIDTGASHNYLASAEVARLGLVLEKGVGRVKAINSAAQPIAGVAKSVLIKVGAYEGKTNLSVVAMDDFKLILGLEFLRDTRTAVLPHADSLMMLGAKPKNLSAMQFEKGHKQDEISYLGTLCFEEMEEVSGPTPGGSKELLGESKDVMPDELPRKLPPKRAVDHEIELVPGTRPPARAPYRIPQPKLVELRKQSADALSRRADLANLESIAALSSSAAAISTKDQVRELLPRDPAAQRLIRLVEQGKARHFWIEDGLLMTKGNRVYVPRGGDLRKSLLSECHDTRWAGHQGQDRTFASVRRAYHWPQMRDDVETHVRTCLICQQDKADHQKKAGLLQPLPIPKRPWESVSMDIISGLPNVGNLGSIIVVVDRLSKYATFIAAPKHVTAEGTAHLFSKHIVKHWGLPKDIVSDRDSRFTGVFRTELFKLLGSTPSMSSSYHPQSDGTQKDWVKLLDVAQLYFNVQKSSSTTNKSAFEIITGQQPLLPHTLDILQSVRSPLTRSFSQEWKKNVDIVRSCLETAQKRMKKYADQNRRFIEFNAGDLVLVKVPNPKLSKSSRWRDPRLMQKYVGPLPVLRRNGTVAYKVELPPWWKIHNVFHVSQLKKYSADKEDDTRNQPSRPQLKLKKTKEKVAEVILDHRVTSTAKKDHTEYLVKWRGCSSEENTWERVTNLKAFLPLVEAYHASVAPGTSLSQVGENVTGCPFTRPRDAHFGHSIVLHGRPLSLHRQTLDNQLVLES